MSEFDPSKLKQLFTPKPNSHKGQNGKVMVVAGSKLFHAAALWSLEASSHIADMVYFASVSENNDIVHEAKSKFQNGIVIPREKIDDYIKEADSILIGPGLPRSDGMEKGDDDTQKMTKRLLTKYPKKRWVVDGGSLQVIDPSWIPENAILTPHTGEFEKLFREDLTRSNLAVSKDRQGSSLEWKQKLVQKYAKKYNCIIVLKGHIDIVCSSTECVTIAGGNAGMTKGGTGDILAGTAVGLYAKNDAFLSACAASYFNKKAGERLFEEKGYWFNSSELVATIPQIMRDKIL